MGWFSGSDAPFAQKQHCICDMLISKQVSLKILPKRSNFVAFFWRAFLPALIALFYIGIGGVEASVTDTDKTLPLLEDRLFQHTYNKDSIADRLSRLEKMVFGEVKTGSDSDRLSKILQAVPAPANASAQSDGSAVDTVKNSADPESYMDKSELSGQRSETPVSSAEGINSNAGSNTNARNSAKRHMKKVADENNSEVAEHSPLSDEKYPAVSAMEKKLLGHDCANDPIDQRLTNLEIKVFGKPSRSTDLSERVDALKDRTGIDIAHKAPPGSDWDDEDDDTMMPPRQQAQAPVPRYNASGEDGKSFSGRDLRKDLQQSFSGGGNSGFGSARSGAGGMSGGSFGADGFDDDVASSPGYPINTPSFNKRGPAPNMVPDVYSGGGVGLNQQVTALENEVFSKVYAREPLAARLSRLESTVFPKEKPAVDQSLPDRVARLVKAVPISNYPPASNNRQVAKSLGEDDLSDLGNGAQPAAPKHSSSGGLSKILGSIGNMFGGGFTGGYPVQSGTVITDPQSGMLYDQYTGNLIDPNTGAVVGRRAVPVNPAYGSGFGFGGFNNGFSPYGTPYGSPYGMSPGGIRFGLGGGRGFGGLWP